MKRSKKYYDYIDIIRVISCVAILLYHLNLLKGGYLAVCVFFVLSGYLSCISAFKKEKFSFKDYYLNRLKKIYLPLIITVFITILIVSFVPMFSWLNLKPETTSILFGYNNFWQLNANLDYFARHINSPFIHLWYIAILIQFDLIFPYIYTLLKKLGDKVHKILPCIITGILSIISLVYFYISSKNNNMMFTYYNTGTRIFSLLFGLTLGFIHSYYEPFIPRKMKKKPKFFIAFYIYLLILIILMVFISSKSKHFAISMILTTLITLRLIDYATVIKSKIKHFNKSIKFISNISYEIYLVQYPLIYTISLLFTNHIIRVSLIILLTFITAALINYSLNLKNKKTKIVKYIPISVLLIASLFGAYKYITAKDYTNEMKALENHLNENEKIMQEKQEEYKNALKEEEEHWQQILDELDTNKDKLNEVVTNLKVVGIGDSVMLGALENLYKTFPHGYFDAKISRTAWVANNILVDLSSKGMLGNPVILNLGANGDCSLDCKKKILETCGNREVFWVNVTNDKDVNVNDTLEALAKNYTTLHIIDWKSISKGHPEYFVYDGIHLTEEGRSAYSKALYNAIYEVYYKKYQQKKDEIINEYKNELKNKISFYGNDILINAFNYLHDYYPEAKYNTDKSFTYETLKSEIEREVNSGTLTHKVVFVLDKNISLNRLEYEEIFKLCKGHEIYIVATTKEAVESLNDLENIQIIDFYKEIESNPSYLMPDNIHLTDKGNKALSEALKTIKTNQES